MIKRNNKYPLKVDILLFILGDHFKKIYVENTHDRLFSTNKQASTAFEDLKKKGRRTKKYVETIKFYKQLNSSLKTPFTTSSKMILDLFLRGKKGPRPSITTALEQLWKRDNVLKKSGSFYRVPQDLKTFKKICSLLLHHGLGVELDDTLYFEDPGKRHMLRLFHSIFGYTPFPEPYGNMSKEEEKQIEEGYTEDAQLQLSWLEDIAKFSPSFLDALLSEDAKSFKELRKELESNRITFISDMQFVNFLVACASITDSFLKEQKKIKSTDKLILFGGLAAALEDIAVTIKTKRR
jgi:hypothetical protein